MNKFSDETILAGLRSPNQRDKNNALSHIYSQHYQLIVKFITRNNGNEEEAADIFQDAIVAFYEKIRLGQLDLNCSIQTYIYSICRHLWLNRLRTQKKLAPLNEEIAAIPIAEESTAFLHTNERQTTLIKLMDKLGADCKKVLSYYYFDRIKMKEIALLMEYATEQVAKNKKSSCMKKLKSVVLESAVLKNILR